MVIFRPGSFYRQRNGNKCYCVGLGPKGGWVFSSPEALATGSFWFVNAGGIHGVNASLDVIGEWREPMTRTFRVYLYQDGSYRVAPTTTSDASAIGFTDVIVKEGDFKYVKEGEFKYFSKSDVE